MRFKHNRIDRWDCTWPGAKIKIHDHYGVSARSDSFHCSAGWMHYDTGRRGHKFGINNKVYKISGAGIMVDGEWIGKPEAK